MADYRLKLSDGTTTIDLYGGSDSIVREGGLAMPPPNVKASYLHNPFSDGSQLTSATYSNRTINIQTRIWGSNLADLKTNIRSIQRLLNDAEKRTLLGYGAQVYLEYQWGDAANQSTFFDILRGDLLMPGDYLNVHLKTGYMIPNAQIKLVCKPFGRYTNQDIVQATLENFQNAYAIQESFLVDDDSTHQLDDDDWEAEQWKTTSAYTAVGAMIKGYRLSTPTDLTLAIFATAASKPTGSAIATGTVDISAIPTNGTYSGWVKVIFASGVALSDATEYALVAHCDDGAGKGFLWRSDSTAGHANGQRCFSANSGTDWTADATDDNLYAIISADTDANYQDITTAEAYGDVPAKLYWLINPANETGEKKLWLAKRSGARYDDDLWFEGEDFTSYTISGGGYDNEHHLKLPSSTESSQMYAELVVTDVALGANTALGYFTFNMATAPRGQFRVLARCRAQTQDAADFDHISWGAGYRYGDVTKAPSETDDEYYQVAANNTWEVLDLGLLNIPPIIESDIATNNVFGLRIWHYATEAFGGGETYKWDLDWVFLLPIDEGLVIISTTKVGDGIVMDGITSPTAVYSTVANVIVDKPGYVGTPFSLGRETTRLYIVRDDDNSVTFASDVKYQPQFLVI